MNDEDDYEMHSRTGVLTADQLHAAISALMLGSRDGDEEDLGSMDPYRHSATHHQRPAPSWTNRTARSETSPSTSTYYSPPALSRLPTYSAGTLSSQSEVDSPAQERFGSLVIPYLNREWTSYNVPFPGRASSFCSSDKSAPAHKRIDSFYDSESHAMLPYTYEINPADISNIYSYDDDDDDESVSKWWDFLRCCRGFWNMGALALLVFGSLMLFVGAPVIKFAPGTKDDRAHRVVSNPVISATGQATMNASEHQDFIFISSFHCHFIHIAYVLSFVSSTSIVRKSTHSIQGSI
jgi:hypothetical protein